MYNIYEIIRELWQDVRPGEIFLARRLRNSEATGTLPKLRIDVCIKTPFDGG